MTAADIIATLRPCRFSLSDEVKLQGEMHDVLIAAGFASTREVRLSDRDRIDLVIDRVGIEVKVKGQRRAIYHQVERYAQHDCLDEIILATNVAMGMPPAINGKPILILNLSKAWL